MSAAHPSTQGVTIEPLPDDPSADVIRAMFDLDENWWLSDAGDIDTAAAGAFQNDGTNYQTVIITQFPVRRKGDEEGEMFKLALSVDAAILLYQNLEQTLSFLAERQRRAN